MTSFAAASALHPLQSGDIAPVPGTPMAFTADVHPNWTIAGKPNGGYLLAMMGRAATVNGPHPHVIAASAQYQRSPDPGPAAVVAEVLRAGRSASQVRVQLLQDDVVCVEALLTTSTLSADTEPYWAAGVPVVPDAAFDRSVRVPSVNPSGVSVLIMDEVDLRIDRETLGFAVGAPSGSGELRGWLELLEDEPFDPCSLLYAVDAFPPATFEIELTGWVPTLALTVYVRALPAPGPLRVLQRAHLVEDQRVDEACWVWDSRGRVVAHGVQLAGIRLG